MNNNIFNFKYLIRFSNWFFLCLSILLLILFIYNSIHLALGDDTGSLSDNYNYGENFSVIEFQIKSIVRLLFLSFYFFLVSKMFRTINVDTLFSIRVVKLLRLFGFLIFVPFLFALFTNLISYFESWFFIDALIGNLAYVTAGILSLFMAKVFSEGYKLKQENDLTI